MYNALYPHFNANVDFAGTHCVAKPPEVAPVPEKSFLERISPF